jgi:hypothetical protein
MKRLSVAYALLVAFLLAAPARAGDPVMGNWEGNWKNDDGHGDKLTAQVIAEGGDNYRAVFTAYYGPIAVFRVALKGERKQDAIRFGGKVDLGVLFGGVFEWTGGIADDKFSGKYKGQKDVGEFVLKKVHKASATLGARPPAGAVVLFDGKNLDAWQTADGKPAPWKLTEDGACEVTHGQIYTKAEFGDIATLHIEFRTPFMPEARGQGRGNSGIFIDRTLESQERDWEIQVLDSFGLEPKNNECGAVYGIQAPSSNACLPPEEWQTYDITFTAPRYNESRERTAQARITVIQNGTKIIDNIELDGTGKERGHIVLQDHGNPVRYRNVWLIAGDR